MNASPATFAQQVAKARKANTVPFGGDVLAYRSQTGVQRPVRPEPVAPVLAVEDDPHCFVCGRHTDHFAEHDDLVEQGKARYGEDGSVYDLR
jgi:hypothetical protein